MAHMKDCKIQKFPPANPIIPVIGDNPKALELNKARNLIEHLENSIFSCQKLDKCGHALL